MRTTFPWKKSGWLAFVVILAVLACRKERSQEGANITGKRCIGCDYLPVCDSSIYRYTDSTSAGIDTFDNVVRILGDTMVAAVQFSKVSLPGILGDSLLYNCNAQEYRALINLAALGLNAGAIADSLLGFPLPSGTIPAFGVMPVTLLKTTVDAGATWKDVLYKVSNPLFNVEVSMDAVLKEKGLSWMVAGKNYTDVMHVSMAVNLVMQTAPAESLANFDIYYAKGAGIIESRISDETGITLKRQLISKQ